MGRKRTSNKVNLNLWVDKDIVEKLRSLELNASAIFTHAAQSELEKLDQVIQFEEKEEL